METYTKAQLNRMDLEELLDIAVEQEKIYTENRGYFSGMTRGRLALLGEEILRDCIYKTQKNFIKSGWI